MWEARSNARKICGGWRIRMRGNLTPRRANHQHLSGAEWKDHRLTTDLVGGSAKRAVGCDLDDGKVECRGNASRRGRGRTNPRVAPRANTNHDRREFRARRLAREERGDSFKVAARRLSRVGHHEVPLLRTT
jgi:hypothetical protein